MVALTNAVGSRRIADGARLPGGSAIGALDEANAGAGLEIKLERTHDLSAVIHAERLSDGRVLITAMPLLYGSYTVTQRDRDVLRLEPPSI